MATPASPGAAPATNTEVGQQAYKVAATSLNPPTPYVWGGNGPPGPGGGFDCSGLMVYAYNTGPGAPGIALGGRTVAQFWNNSTTLIRVVDCTAADKGISESDLQTKLAVGDLLIFGPPGINSSQGHVQMYAGGGQVIEAPYTGVNCQQHPETITAGASPSDPFLGAMRPAVEGNAGAGKGAAGGGGNNNGAPSSQGAGPSGTAGSTWQKEVAAQQAALAKLPDPRDNLPFSQYFQMMHIAPGNQLVRGGIIDLTTKQFRLYFMMNPQQISMGSNIDTSNLTSPLQQDPSVMQYGGYWVTNQTITFTIYFNRMYEVWSGNTKGPSQIGCRWDIRALERLMGIFDAQTKGGASVGVGNYGAGGYPPMTYPLQVVFGGSNSYQFQGTIASMDYTYTLFDRNMVPIEAYADLGIMRIYQPSMSSPDLVNSLPMTATAKGQYLSTIKATSSTSASTAQFNLKKGSGS